MGQYNMLKGMYMVHIGISKVEDLWDGEHCIFCPMTRTLVSEEFGLMYVIFRVILAERF